jgi:hypothetical protein
MTHPEEPSYGSAHEVTEGQPPIPFDVQMTMVGGLVANAQYEKITSQHFPDINPADLAFARFHATSNAINHLIGISDTAQDKDLQRKLKVRAGGLIAQRDQELSDAIGEIPGEPNEGALVYQRATITRPTDEFPLLMQATSMGLVDEITPESFPHLATMHPRSRTRLEMLAASNDIENLEAARRHVQPSTGFTSDRPQDPSAQHASGINRELRKEIGQRREWLSQLAGKLLRPPARRRTIAPPEA